ncbi:MAG TPA: YkgJ family cysteine cluster protein [Candidatus Nanoarchaeia archaeon]|nr:YkgJ family cysteine cluster protein [Candidatus Nanoarchaeia archaeon]
MNCEECKGACCEYASVTIDEPENDEDFDEIRWLIAHENVIVYIDNENDWIVEFSTPCKFYHNEQNKCIKYDTRPIICKDHKVEDCVKNGEGNVEKITFYTWEDVEAYRKLTKNSRK